MSRQQQQDHYNNAAPGEWTYAESTHEAIIFRKGSSCDPNRPVIPLNEKMGGGVFADKSREDWLVGSSEWAWVNNDLLPQFLDIMNIYEKTHGKIVAIHLEQKQ